MIRAPNKRLGIQTAYFVSGRRQAASTMLHITLPASPSLPETKTLVFGATINFIRHSIFFKATHQDFLLN
jgi:hypothetical protein